MNSFTFVTFMMVRIGLESFSTEGPHYGIKSPSIWDSWSFSEDSTSDSHSDSLPEPLHSVDD